MRVEFRQSIASDRVSFTQGQIVTVATLPNKWRPWLETGVIRLLPEDSTEQATVRVEPERAVTPRGRGRRRRQTVA